ncbi:MAG: hypothetical protein ABIR51_05150 [Sphingomicrobium sp.]
MAIKQLPRFDGRFGLAVHALYIVLATVTAFVIAGSIVFNGLDHFRNLPAAMQWGFRTFTTVPDNHPEIAEVNADAQAAGLRAKDRVLAVDRKPVGQNATEFTLGARFSSVEADRMTLTTQRLDGSIGDHSLSRQPATWTRIEQLSGLPLWFISLWRFSYLLAIPILALAASFLLYRRRSDDPEAMLFAFGLLLLSYDAEVDFWLFAVVGMPLPAFAALVAAGQSAILVAIAGFPDGRFPTRWSRMVAIASLPVLLFTILAHLPQMRSPVLIQISNLAMAVMAAVAMIALAMRYRALPEGAARQQIKWVFAGICVTAIALLIRAPLPEPAETAVRGHSLYYLFYYSLRLIGFTALPLGLMVSLLHYRLYDAEVTISRSAGYAVMAALLLAVFGGSQQVISMLGEQYFGGGASAIASGIAAGIAAVLITPLHHRVAEWARDRFQSSLLRLTNNLPVVVGDLRETASLAELGRATLAEVAEGVRAKRLALVVDGKTVAATDVAPPKVAAWLKARGRDDQPIAPCDRDDRDFPLRVPLSLDGEETFGWMLLGPRPDNSFYGTDERNALAEVAGPVSRAIRVVLGRDILATALDRRITVLERAVDELRPARSGLGGNDKRGR